MRVLLFIIPEKHMSNKSEKDERYSLTIRIRIRHGRRSESVRRDRQSTSITREKKWCTWRSNWQDDEMEALQPSFPFIFSGLNQVRQVSCLQVTTPKGDTAGLIDFLSKRRWRRKRKEEEGMVAVYRILCWRRSDTLCGITDDPYVSPCLSLCRNGWWNVYPSSLVVSVMSQLTNGDSLSFLSFSRRLPERIEGKDSTTQLCYSVIPRMFVEKLQKLYH